MKTRLRPGSLAATVVCTALGSTATWAQAQPSGGSRGAPQEHFTCALPGTADHREIGIYQPGKPKRCRVDYTRDGRTRSLWSSGHDYRFCVSKALEIVRLLENVNFNCAPHTDTNGSASGG